MAILFQFVVDEEVVEVVGEIEVVLVDCQFCPETECILPREIALENIDTLLELIMTRLTLHDDSSQIVFSLLYLQTVVSTACQSHS